MQQTLKHLFLCASITLLAACGSQDSANNDVAGVNTALDVTKTVASSVDSGTQNTDASLGSSLINSLAQLYPNGQLPANRADQAAQDRAQTPAALKLTAETAPSQSIQAQSQLIQPQAVAADYQPVQRVQNTTLYGAYFFSIFPSEIATALATNPNWVLEGPAFLASLSPGVDLHPVHRFRNLINGSYLYTIFDSERADIVANYSATFTYEGIAWYARQTQTQAPGWSALYRFRNITNNTYLFTAYESEKNNIVANFSSVFVLEGIAYYVRQAAPAVGVSPLALGDSHTCALKNDGTVNCWGWNPFGQLGDGTTTDRTTPTTVPGLTGVVALATGEVHTCALKTDGTVSCWGRNTSGQLGDGSLVDRTSPVSVTGLTGVTALEAGGSFTCALKTDGTVRCWGRNTWGQLGDGTTTNRTTPTAVLGLTGVADLAVGFAHTCALKNNGTVSCWGLNTEGQLGDGTKTNRNGPTAVIGLTGVASLSAGEYHSCALKNEGTASCWGFNSTGQLGDGTTMNRTSPVIVTGLTGLSSITAGGFHTCALKNDGTVNCWGYNGYGQLGDGTTANKTSATPVPGLGNVAYINTGYYHTCALKNDGTASCWGSNFDGHLGDGTKTDRPSPTAVAGGAVYWK